MRYEYVELFAGAGGLSRGLEAVGFHCRAHAEIEPHARAVLRAKWGSTRLDGDVTQLHGADYAGITLLSGGSPCQDLSVAGKRAGLSGARSGLFYEQVRIWNESNAPYFLWENVYGALSSNAGADFAAVLSTLVGATLAVPTDGWRRAGVAAGPTAVAAWRVLDLQHFGPPQRRVRVFIVAARTGGVDPAEVLAVCPCGERDFKTSPRERQRIAASTAGGVGSGAALSWDSQINTMVEAHGPLLARGKSGADHNGVVAFHQTQTPVSGDVSPALGATSAGMGVIGVDLAPTLGARDHKGPGNFHDGALQATVIQPVVGTLDVHDSVKWGSNPLVAQNKAMVSAGRPRRLTPLECERLMSWPDHWTATGIKEDGTEYALSDTARYRLCGNGVGSVQVQWIATRLMSAIVALDSQQLHP